VDLLDGLPRLLEGSVLEFELALSVECPLRRVPNSRVHVAVERLKIERSAKKRQKDLGSGRRDASSRKEKRTRERWGNLKRGERERRSDMDLERICELVTHELNRDRSTQVPSL